jgi:hypothetical protein
VPDLRLEVDDRNDINSTVPDLRLEVEDDRKDIKSTVDSIIVSSLLVDVNTDAESNR